MQTPAVASSNTALVDTFTGSTPAQMLIDGENSIKSNDLDALTGFPMFSTKKVWTYAPAIGEELRLVAVTGDHVNRFLNKLIVTGLSNVAKIELARYGRQLQISTLKFGNSGSIQAAGGTANLLSAAVVDAGKEIEDKIGALSIPFELRKGFVEGQWTKTYNTVRQNKDLGFNESTQVKLTSNKIELSSALNGSFQTLRPTSLSATTEVKIEKHGDFMAFVKANGASLGLYTAGVKEGDWVKIRHPQQATWSSSTTYTAGQRVSFGSALWTSLSAGNLNNTPTEGSAFWRNDEIDRANQGIYQVVRIFGEDTFWVYNPNGAEEITNLGDVTALQFYSYDSVMPGDTLVINTGVVNPANIGRYTVQDEDGVSTAFPSSTAVFVTPINNITGGFVTLGGEFLKLNMEEKEPLVLWKRLYGVGAGTSTFATVLFDTPDLISKISSSLGAAIQAYGKLGFNQDINFGVDAYRYYTGLIQELNKVIYGDAADPINYVGVKAAGTKLDIDPAIVKRIKVSLAVRVKTGVPFSELRERIKASVAGYVNQLGVGESVSISSIVAAAGSIPGVVAVSVVSPQYDSSNDLIPIGAYETAFIANPTLDVTISVI